jgi:lipoprotein-releasing system permease protein
LTLAKFIVKKISSYKQSYFTVSANRIGVITLGGGVAVMLIILLSISGLYNAITAKLFTFQGHIHIIKYSLSKPYDSHDIHIEKNKIEELKSLDNISSVMPFATKACLLQKKQNVSGILLKGVAIEDLKNQLDIYVQEGTVIQQAIDDEPCKQIMVSQNVAKKLNIKINDSIILTTLSPIVKHQKLVVTAIYSTGIQDIDDKVAICDLKLIRYLNNWSADVVGGYQVILKDYKKAQQTRDHILDLLEYKFNVRNVLKDYSAIVDWLKLIYQNSIIFSFFTFLVIISNIVCITLIQTVEKAHMTGILKALGATNYDIRNIFFANISKIIFRAILYGNIGALALYLLQYYFKIIKLNPEYYHIAYLTIDWSWPIIVLVNVISILLTISAALVTTHIISKNTVIKSLKFK